jgi:hemerythrin superfamily protein
MATKKRKSKSKSSVRRASSKRPLRARQPDAIGMLKADHARVETMFDEFEKSRKDSRKVQLAQLICMELKVHTALEEEIFYPAVREALGEDDLLDEAEVEHASAKDLIRQIEGGSPQEDKWDAKVMVLGEYIKHHVKEEHSEMFPKARKSRLDLKVLAEQMSERRDQLMAQ